MDLENVFLTVSHSKTKHYFLSSIKVQEVSHFRPLLMSSPRYNPVYVAGVCVYPWYV